MMALADLPLFGAAEQREHLERVGDNLAGPILLFCRQRLWGGRPQFHMEDLRNHLRASGIAFAPDSPSRILRELRLAGRIDYRVVNRRASLYEITRA